MFNCDVIANNNTDFIICKNIKNGVIPVLTGGIESKKNLWADDVCIQTNVDTMDFDIDLCLQQNDDFRVRLKETEKSLKDKNTIEEKLVIIQNFIEKSMPFCKKDLLGERTASLFDGEPFSFFLKHKLCMCQERASIAQYLCQKDGSIDSYMVNSFAEIKNQHDLHAYIIFEKDNRLFVYDPANPAKNNKPRIMDSGMDKFIFSKFIDAINENANSTDKKKKRRVGFRCLDAGKVFLYCSHCGTQENMATPKRLKEALTENLRLAQTQEDHKQK